MLKQNKLRPQTAAFLLDAMFILIVTLLVTLKRDYLNDSLYFDWLNIIHYTPLYFTYILLTLLYYKCKQKRAIATYIISSLVSCAVIGLLWSVFFYDHLPATRSEKTYEQFKQNQIIFSENATRKISHWVDDEHISSAQLIDSCKTYNAERRAVFQEMRASLENAWHILYFILSNLTVFSPAVRLTFLMIETDAERREAEKQKIEAEHKMMIYQLNPHFLMNTLNNIHAQIDINSEAAQESVLLLSKMMRYILYESSHDYVPLAKEVDFLSNYFDLMRKRYLDTASIELIVPKEIPNINIPHVLFINLAENAFKHGVTYDSNTFLRFELKFENDRIICHSVNSKIKNENDIQVSKGFGIKNLRNRLDLFYGDNYTYEIEDTEDTYTVNLIIPIV